MQHVEEDTILKQVLGLLPPSTDGAVRRHLQECSTCAALRDDVSRTIEAITEVAPEFSSRLPRIPKVRKASTDWLRAAAVLLIGFGLGFLASESSRSVVTTVVRQQFVPKPPASQGEGFVACDVVDLLGRLD